MKRAIKVLLAILLATVMVVAVAACTPTEKDPCANGHSWDDGQKVTADCTQPGKLVRHCKVCGASWETDLAAGEHTWGEYKVTKAPTCTEDGIETRTCSVCGKTEDQTITSDGHVWGEYKVTKAPTCTEDGLETRTCSVCGETDQKTLPAAHSWGEVTVTKAPTCKQPGIGSAQCTVCGEHSDSIEIPATGIHSWNDGSVTKAPDCETAGVLTYTCTVCGDTTTQSLPANGHAYGRLIPQADATCTENGTKAHYQCSVCGKLFDEFKTSVSASDLVIRSTGHSLSERQAKAATCTEEGYEAYYQCRRCNKLFADDAASQPIDAPVATPKADHTPQPYGAKAATCTQQGATAGSKCAVCGKILITPKATPALGHEFYYVEHDEQETHTERCRRCDHSVEQACIPDTQWAANDDYHWHTCLLCDGEVDRAVHSTESGSKQCTICGREIGEVVVRVDGADDKICTSVKTAIEYISETYPNGDVTATIVINADRDGDGVTIEGNIHVVIDLSNLVYKISKGTTIVGGQADVTFTNGTVDGKITYKGGTLRFSEVDSTKLIIDMNGATCDDAEIYFDGVLRTHSAVEGWQVDETARKHYHVCAYCSARIDEAACVTENKYDNSDHWSECTTCHEKYDLAGHTMAYQNTAPGTHKHYCTECDYVDESDTACTPDSGDTNHDQTHGLDGGWYADADFHWRKCAKCGEEYGKEAHQFDKKESGGLCKDCGHKFFDVKISDGNGLDQSAPTIAEAFAWIETNGVAGRTYTVTLTHNRSDTSSKTVTVPAGYTIVLDLAGHTVTYTNGNLSIEDGSLEIKGDENAFKVKAIVYGGGTLKLPAGEYNFEIKGGYTCLTADITVGTTRLTHKYPSTWQKNEADASTHKHSCEYCGTDETATHNYPANWTEHQTSDTFGKHTRTCPDCQEVETADCTIVNSYCSVCKHLYSATEVFAAIDDKITLKGTYQFSGTVYDMDLDGTYKNIYFYIVEGETTYRFEAGSVNLGSFLATDVHIGSIVTVSGSGSYLQYYKSGGVYQFYKGGATNICVLDDVENPACNITVEDNSNEFVGITVTVTDSKNNALLKQYNVGQKVDFKVNVSGGKLIEIKVNGVIKQDENGIYSFTVEKETVISIKVGDITAPSEDSHEIDIPTVATENNWTKNDGSFKKDSGNLSYSDDLVSITPGGTYEQQSSFWVGGSKTNQTDSWRFYERGSSKSTSDGSITITRNGTNYLLVSVTFIYYKTDSGVLKHGDTEVTSGTAYVFTTEEQTEGATFDIRHSAGSTNGRIDIVKIIITYKYTTNHQFGEKKEAIQPSCETPGVVAHYECSNPDHAACRGKYFDEDGNVIAESNTTFGEATGHDWKLAEQAWTWESTTATLHLVCTNDDEHVLEIEVEGTAGQTFDATCQRNAFTVYTVTINVKDIQSKLPQQELDKLSVTDEQKSTTEIEQSETKLSHDFSGKPVHKEGSDPSVHVYTCTTCAEGTVKATKEESCDQNTQNHNANYHWQECSKCGFVAEETKEEHSFGDDNSHNCDCGQQAPHVHIWQEVADQESTCQVKGTYKHVTCTSCGICYDTMEEALNGSGNSYSASHYDREFAAHNYGGQPWQSDKVNHWHECKWCNEPDKKVPHDSYTYTNDGATHTATCEVCSHVESGLSHELTVSHIDGDRLNHKVSCICNYEGEQQHKFGDKYNDNCVCGEVRVNEESFLINTSSLNLDGTGYTNQPTQATVGTGTTLTIQMSNLMSTKGIQFRKSPAGSLYNSQATPGKISKIVIVYNSDTGGKSLKLYVADSNHPTSGAVTLTADENTYTWNNTTGNDYRYFTVSNPGTHTCNVDSITIYYEVCTHTVAVASSEKAPGCTTPGSKTGICIRCGQSVTEEIAAKGHNVAEKITHEAESFCDKEGHVTYYECPDCNSLFTDDTLLTETTLEKVTKIAPLGHKEGDSGNQHWAIDNELNKTEHKHVCRLCEKDISDLVALDSNLKYSNYDNDSTHTEECLVDGCDYYKDNVAHTKSYAYDSDFHWEKCACGWTGTHTSHVVDPVSKLCDCGYTSNAFTIGETENADTLENAFEEAATGDIVIKLNQDYTGAGATFSGSATVTLEIGTHTFAPTSNITVAGSGTLKITGAMEGVGFEIQQGTLNLQEATVTNGTVTMTVKGSTAKLIVGTTASTFTSIIVNVSAEYAENAQAEFTKAQSEYNNVLHVTGGAICKNLKNFKFAGTPIDHSDLGKTGFCDICNEPQDEPVWKLVKKADDAIAVGDYIIIAAAGSAYAISIKQQKNNRSATAITKNEDDTATIDDNVQIISVQAGDPSTQGTVSFYVEATEQSGYLSAVSSSSNDMHTNGTLVANGSWKITIDDNGVADIVAQGTASRNVLRYNGNTANNLLFSCYASGNVAPVVIYRWTGESAPIPEHVCKHKCTEPDCGLCTDKSCNNPVCADKCPGHGGSGGGDTGEKQAQTITVDFSSPKTGLRDIIGFSSTDKVDFTFAGLSLQCLNCKKASSSTSSEYEFLMLNKGNTTYLANTEAIGGYITKIEITIPSGSSGSAVYHVALSTASMLSNQTTGTTITISSEDKSVSAKETDKYQFFNISITKAANGQIAKIIITYIPE